MIDLKLKGFSQKGHVLRTEEKYGILRLEIQDIHKALETANKVYESGLAEFSTPDFYIPIVLNQIDDDLFPLQFQMHNTGQVIDGVAGVNDIDCNALEAWNVSLGDNVTVAIIDQGLEGHEDFGNRLIGGFTPATNGDGSPILNNDIHGMNCAGIVGASDNDLGIRGVAPNVNFLSVNIFAGGTTTGDIADGIQWAVNNGSDVLSNSWSFPNAPCDFNNVDIDNSIQNAVTNGRNGNGAIVVFASGNTGGCVNYPARNNNVISVGAIDNRGNLFGYSSRGPELDLVAPSGETNYLGNVRTTDRMGGAGRVPGHYEPRFGGTSAACPVVAGAAALVLSVKPNLTQQEVRDILTSTATDMGVNGFDDNFGFGRVNAFAAVRQAQAVNTRILGDNLICDGDNKTYSLSDSNYSATWQVSSSLQIVSSTSTSVTVTPTSFNIREWGFVRAIIGTQTIERKVWVGKPDAYTEDANGIRNYMGGSFNFQPQPGARGEFSVFSDAPIVNYNWSGPNNVGWWQINRNTIEIDLSFPGTHVFTAQFSNECGTHYYFVFVSIGGLIPDFRISPNPASDSFMVSSITNQDPISSRASKGPVLYELYDLSSSLKLKGNLQNSRNIDISALRKGIYILKIISKDKVEHHRLMIE